MAVSKSFVIAFVTVLFPGCASSPNSMQAQQISTVRYDAYTCNQLVTGISFSGQRAGELYGQLDTNAGNDAAQVGLVLFWPALFFLEGGDGTAAQE
jgi:hypothetical protein